GLIEVGAESVSGRRHLPVGKAQPYGHRLAGAEGERIMRRGFGAHLFRVYRAPRAVHDVVVDAILAIGGVVLLPLEPLAIGFVFSEQQLWRLIAVEPASVVVLVVEFDARIAQRAQTGPSFIQAVSPGVAEPDCR